MSKVVNGHFKVHMSDTGVRMRMYGDDVALAILYNDLSYIIRVIAENVLAECIVKGTRTPKYCSKNKGEDNGIRFRHQPPQGSCSAGDEI